MQTIHIQSVVSVVGTGVLGLFVFAGCSPGDFGRSPLDEMRDQRLITDVGREPEPVEMHTKESGIIVPENGPVSLDVLFALADERNARLAASRAAIGSAGGRAWQASLYPNPSVEFESENIRPSNGGFGRSETTIGIAQPILVGDRRRAAVAVGRAEMEVRRWELASLRHEIRGEIRREVTAIAFLLSSIELHESVLDLADRTVEIAETRFEARAAAESEAIRARVERNSLLLEIDRLQGELSAAGERLQSLLGGYAIDPGRIEMQTVIGESESFGPLTDLDALKARVESTHPAVHALCAEVRNAEHIVEMERAKGIPDITGRLGIGVDHDSDESFIEGSIGIPLAVSDRNQGAILAARFELMQKTHEVEALLHKIHGELGDAFHRWRSASGRFARFNEVILHDAERAFEQTEVGYTAGRMTILDVLDSQRTLTEAKLMQLNLEREAQMALADILAVVGSPQDESYDTSTQGNEQLTENKQ